MNPDEFIEYIKSLGFRLNEYRENYNYKEFILSLYYDDYSFYNGSEWIYDIPYNDLTPVLKIIRSHKLKQLLR